MFSRLRALTHEYRIVRGMLAYGTLWPIGNLLEQTLVEKRRYNTYDWKKCLRISLYGTFLMGPTMFWWMRFVTIMFPGRSVAPSVAKALCEQLVYDPIAIAVFLFVMTVAEGHSAAAGRNEVRAKYFDTYKVGVIYWPIVQTFNFALVPSKNQVVFTGFFSMLWSSFLAYMKHLELEKMSESAEQ